MSLETVISAPAESFQAPGHRGDPSHHVVVQG
jgi:hypothetical protein